MDTRETDTQDSEEENIKKWGEPPFYEDWRIYMTEDTGLNENMPYKWWARLDERTLQILRTLKELKDHQAEANGYIKDNMKRSVTNTARVNALYWAVGLLVTTIVAAIWTKILGLWY